MREQLFIFTFNVERRMSKFYTMLATESEKIKPRHQRNSNTETKDMAENLELTATDTEGTVNPSEPVTPQDLAELIQEFEQYRQRLSEDMTRAAQKAKLPKSKLKAKLEPELAKIDATLENLRTQHAALTVNS